MKMDGLSNTTESESPSNNLSQNTSSDSQSKSRFLLKQIKVKKGTKNENEEDIEAMNKYMSYSCNDRTDLDKKCVSSSTPQSHEASPDPEFDPQHFHKRSNSDPQNLALSKVLVDNNETNNDNQPASVAKRLSLVGFKYDARSDCMSSYLLQESKADGSREVSIERESEELSHSRNNTPNSLLECNHQDASLAVPSSKSSQQTTITGKGDLSSPASLASFNSSSSFNRSSVTNKSSEKKKRASWYNKSRVLSPTYKSKSEDFKKTFKDVPDSERLVVDYSCAMQKDILVHGRLYVTENWICFYANIFRWETVITIKCRDIKSITKERTARVIPNAIQICTDTDKYFFTSFGARDKSYLMLFRVWQNALIDKQMSQEELWTWVHRSYGEELGLTSSDDDYCPPAQDDQQHSPENNLDKEPTDEDTSVFPAEISQNNNNSVTGVPSLSAQNLEASDCSINSNQSQPSLRSSQQSIALARQGQGDVTRRKKPPTSLEVPKLLKPSHSGESPPTDCSDTTEDEDSEVQCTGHEHNGFTSLDDVYYIPVDKLYDLLFTDSQLYRDFIAARKTYDLVTGEWTQSGENRERQITYTLSLNYSIGPKCSPSVEKQTLYGEFSKPGAMYVVDTEVVNNGVPYSDNFYVINRYCITRINNKKSRLVITSQVKFRTKAWGLVKKLLLKTAREGLEQNFQLLGEFLHKEAEHAAHLKHSSQTVKKKRTRRRKISERPAIPVAKKVSNTDISPAVKSSSKANAQAKTGIGTAAESLHISFSVDSLVRIICFVLILLVFFNAVLFYKLWSLEKQALAISNRYSPTKINFVNAPKNSEEWLKLLEQQEQLHETEIGYWKEIISSSLLLMDHMKVTLQELQNSLEHRKSCVFNNKCETDKG